MIEENVEEVKEVKLIKKKRVEFQLEEEILNLLDARVKVKGLSRSEYLRNLILKDTQNGSESKSESIDINTLKRIKKLTIEYKKMRIAFTKLGVVFNQGIKLFIKGKRKELEVLEDELLDLIEKDKDEIDKYKKYLL